MGSGFAFAQEKPATDSASIVKRNFEKNLQEKYSGSQFDYSENSRENINILGRILNWILQKIAHLFGFEVSPGTLQTTQTIIYILLIIILIYFAVRMLDGQRRHGFLNYQSKGIAIGGYEVNDIEDLDIDAMIKEAIANRDFRLAIRYSYLKTLKLLSTENFIAWSPKKTNSDYISEIDHPEIKELFRKVSYWYDHIWYGNFQLDEEKYTRAGKNFVELENKVTDEK